MRILIDECLLRKGKLRLTGHECLTVREAGLSGKENGELLHLAEGKFDVLLTVDKSLRYQQNLSGRSIAVLLIRAKSNDIDDILPHLPAGLKALESIKHGDVVIVGITDDAANHV